MCPSRRVVVGGALAGGVTFLAGCGGGSAKRAAPSSSRSTSASGNQGSLPAARTAEQILLRAYAATLRAHPTLAPTLSVALAHHRAHAAALAIPADTTGGGPAVPNEPRAAVQALIALEQRTSDERVTQSVADLQHGSLLAALAAAEAVHVDLLTSALPEITTPTTPTTSTTSTTPTTAPRPSTHVSTPPPSHHPAATTSHTPAAPATHSTASTPPAATRTSRPPAIPPHSAAPTTASAPTSAATSTGTGTG